MTTLTFDTLGGWIQLGVVTPSLSSWSQFPTQSTQYSETYRIQFIGDVANIQSWIWLRSSYSVNGVKMVEPSVRVYPKPEALLLSYPINPSLSASGRISRVIEIKKSFDGSKRYSSRTDRDYSVWIEEKWG